MMNKNDIHNLIKVNPLSNWSEEDVEQYVKKHHVPYNKLQDKGYLTIRKDEEDRRKLRLVPEEKLMDLTQDKQEVTQQFMDRMYRDISEEGLQPVLNDYIYV